MPFDILLIILNTNIYVHEFHRLSYLEAGWYKEKNTASSTWFKFYLCHLVTLCHILNIKNVDIYLHGILRIKISNVTISLIPCRKSTNSLPPSQVSVRVGQCDHLSPVTLNQELSDRGHS